MAREIKVKRKEVELPKNSTQVFRQEIQRLVFQNFDKLIESLSKLPPKEFIEYTIRLMPYGFSKVPEERPVEPEDNVKAIFEERQRKVTLLSSQRIDESEVVED